MLAGLSSNFLAGVGTALGAGLVAFAWLVVRRLGQIVRLLRHVAAVPARVDQVEAELGDVKQRVSVVEGALALFAHPKGTPE